MYWTHSLESLRSSNCGMVRVLSPGYQLFSSISPCSGNPAASYGACLIRTLQRPSQLGVGLVGKEIFPFRIGPITGGNVPSIPLVIGWSQMATANEYGDQYSGTLTRNSAIKALQFCVSGSTLKNSFKAMQTKYRMVGKDGSSQI